MPPIVYCYHWVDTALDGFLVPWGIIRSVVRLPVLTLFGRFIYHCQFPSGIVNLYRILAILLGPLCECWLSCLGPSTSSQSLLTYFVFQSLDFQRTWRRRFTPRNVSFSLIKLCIHVLWQYTQQKFPYLKANHFNWA